MALDFDTLDLGRRNKPDRPTAEGKPLQLPLDVIDEDPDQPRTEFDAGALQELADSIRERGVRQPVSVKPSPTDPARYILNFGARRLRASRLAGQETIPAFVDLTADDFDQVAENEQRQGLTAMELALFVKRKLEQGLKQAEIARKLGKPKATISQAAALASAPDAITVLYRSGRCQSLRELYDLGQAYEQHPQEVAQALDGDAPVTRRFVEELRERLAAPVQAPVTDERQAQHEPKVFAGQTLQGQERRDPGTSDQAEVFAGQTHQHEEAGNMSSARPELVPPARPSAAKAAAVPAGLRVVVQVGDALMEVATDARPRKDRIPVRPLGTDDAVQHVAPQKVVMVRVESR